MLRMLFLLVAMSAMVCRLHGGPTLPDVELNPWAKRALAQVAETRQALVEAQRIRAALAPSGLPVEVIGHSEAVLKWYRKATKQDRELLPELTKAEADIKNGILRIWVTTSIGQPICRRSPQRLVLDAEAILNEYEAELKQRGRDRFEDVFDLELIDNNLLAIRGEYYRQAVLVIAEHVAFDRDLVVRSLELDDLSPAEDAEREDLKRAFGEWYYGHMAYGARWDTRDGRRILRPLHGERFLIDHPWL